MMDEPERLGRVVRGFAPPDDAFERLVNRRGRKQRNQRLAAGVVGVIVALATGILLVRSLTSNGVPANSPVEPAPAPPVVSGALAYELGGDIWVADPDGSNAVAITVGAIDDECPGPGAWRLPSWSPDGRYLAFRRFGECSSPSGPETDRLAHYVVIIDLQGNAVANFPAQGGEIAWSPDSTRVAVWDEHSGDEDTIGIYGVDGTRETQIAMPPGWEHSDIRDPIWTPDGGSLIVNQLEVPLDDGTPRELPFPELFRTRSGGFWVAPLAYSPDGSRVAYGTRHTLMVARSDGSEPREVLGDTPYSAAWSPSGELIAVTADAPSDTSAPKQLRVVDVATGSATLLFEAAEPRTMFYVIGFSPEGDRVLFGEQRAPEGSPDGTYVYSLWSVGVDGSDARQIVAGTDDGVWRPT